MKISAAVDPQIREGLRPLARRVRVRWLLDRARLGLLLALAGAALLAVGGRLSGRPEWATVALSWGVLSLGGAVVAGLPRFPDVWAVARAADALGLAERVSSALYAERSGHPASRILVAQAGAELAGLDPAAYALIPRPRRWRGVPALALLLVAAAFAPLPALGDASQRAADARAVAEARRSVEALAAALAEPTEPEPLLQTTAEELAALDEQLARAADAAAAARALEEAQEQLAAAASAEDYAWRRATDSLASTWAERSDLGALARALAEHDAEAVEKALADLAAGLEGMEAGERDNLQLGLQAGANAARDVPALSGALRQAASRLAAAAAEGENDSAAEAADALADLAPALSRGAARAGALQAVENAVAGLGQSRAALGPATGSAAAAGAVAAGPSAGGAADGAGDGSGSGSSGGEGSGPGAGSGAGSGSGSGSGAGAGSGGSGAGAGAGAGGGPSPGQPGAGNAGPTTIGGTAAPNTAGPTRYDPIYAPSLLGGESGPDVAAPGDVAGSGGPTVDLPESPLTLGPVRPYDEVYGDYEAAARQSLGRQPLPPALQGLVQRYFTAIKPATQDRPATGGNGPDE